MRGPLRAVCTHAFTCLVLQGSLALLLLLPQRLFPAQSGELTAKSERGSEAMAAGRFDEAVAIYADLARALPNDAGPLLNLGMAHSLAGRPRDAVRPLARAVQFGDYEAADPLLEALVKQSPSSADLRLLHGDTSLQAQKIDQAIPALEAALRADPSLLPARASLGRAYIQAGRQADAIPHLKAALLIDEDGTLHYQLARAYQATGQTALAREMLEKYAAFEKAKRK